jgi:hypothetical protein
VPLSRQPGPGAIRMNAMMLMLFDDVTDCVSPM